MTSLEAALPLSARASAYAENLPGFGRMRLLPLIPEADADMIHGWVKEERARFWGMLNMSRDEVRDIYLFVDSLETHHAYLISVEEKPVGLFQTYEPLQDPIADAYEARPADTGLHLLLAPTPQPVPGFTPILISGLIRFLLSDPAKDRVVAEPDARNAKMIHRLQGCGFELGPTVQLAEKEAQLAFLSRERFEGA